jgi:hypothetical protein
MRRVIASLIGILVATSVQAGSGHGTITYLIQRASDGLIYVHLSSAPSGRPQCATGSYFMVRDENSNTGKGQYAMLLAAKISGKSVTIEGMNSCVRWPDGEDINYILIHD